MNFENREELRKIIDWCEDGATYDIVNSRQIYVIMELLFDIREEIMKLNKK